ncbi:MAG: type II toxin-antitoxin system VapC family toxin [Firmicutes bacterium]|nr:type II toxin-antitoxin system VapC family toxin [Bacillota bacterium]
MFMLDTNIIIFCIRHPDSACAAKLAAHLGKDVCLSVVTYAELEYGIMNSSDPVRNREAISFFLAGIKILDFDMNAAMHFGDILAELKQKHKDKQNQDRDKMIAAHARSLDFVLVSDNTKDFIDIDGLKLENWRAPNDLV